MFQHLAVMLFCAVVVLSCGLRPGPARSVHRAFPDVQVPSIYEDAEAREEYVAMHWWDEFFVSGNWACDSITVNGVNSANLEMSMASYAQLLSEMDVPKAAESSARLFALLEGSCLEDTVSNAYQTIVDMVEKYFYNPNSPYRNEDIFLPFVSGVAKSSLTDDDLRASYAYAARMCSLNVYGSSVPDFRFVDGSGRQYRLYDIQADNTILFFSNPGCSACREIMDKIVSVDGIVDKMESDRLAVVNVYIDEDLDAWREYLPEYPEQWYNGYDPDLIIRDNNMFNLRAIPSVYLLDADKRVIMKDAPEMRLIEWLDNNK